VARYDVDDGCGSKHSVSIAATFTCFDDLEAADIRSCARALRFSVSENRHGVLAFKGAQPWLRETGIGGHTSHTKRVPGFVYRGSNAQVAEFLGAYFACDGSLSRKGSTRKDLCIDFASVNRNLLSDVQHLLTRLGIRSRIRRANQTRNGEPYVSWRLYITSQDDTAKFVTRVPVHGTKAARLRAWGVRRSAFDNTLAPDTVEAIEPAGSVECRCLTVDEDASFTAEDLAVHNSWEVSVFWPSWHWTRWPATQFVYASYSVGFAVRDAIYSRRLMDTDWYQQRWGCGCPLGRHAGTCQGFRWTTDQNVITHYENDRGGRRFTAGVKAGTTGQGGDILVFDDPIKIEEADSDAVRTAAHRYIDQVFLGRMNDPQGSRVVGIAQRTNHDDVTGHLLRESSLPWVHLKLPTEYDPRAVMDIHEVSPIGWKDPRTHKGELLWPSRFTPEVIEQTKVTLGPHGYAAQHQQDPSPLEGGIIKREWWRFWIPRGLQPETRAALLAPIRSKEGIEYPPAVELPDFKTDDRGGTDELLQSWDASFKDEAGQVRKGRPPDPVSGGCWGRAGAQCFLLDRVNERMDIVALVQAIRDMTTRFPRAVKKIVEDKANGPAAIAILRREVGGLIPASPQGSKVSRVMTAVSSSKDSDARAMSMVALLAAHNVYVPHPAIAPWVWDYIEEHAAFPNGSHDDDVDMTSQALLHLQPWIWRQADKMQGEVLGHSNEPPILDTREMLRRRVIAASGLGAKPANGRPFHNPYARNRGRR